MRFYYFTRNYSQNYDFRNSYIRKSQERAVPQMTAILHSRLLLQCFRSFLTFALDLFAEHLHGYITGRQFVGTAFQLCTDELRVG